VPVPSHDKAARHIIADDQSTLVWMGDMACLEINSLLSTVPPDFESHDLVLVDLDPHPPGVDFEDVISVAENVQVAFKEMKLQYIMKTSGSEGIHFLIPIVPKHNLKTIHRFVLQLGIILEQLSPKTVTTSKHRKDRQGKIFIDYDQNTRNSIVTPYSPRPTLGAPVSFPLKAEDLKKRFKPSDYNVKTVSELAERRRLPSVEITQGQTLEKAFSQMGLEFHLEQ
jgi:bifunctional non-homologous end joining protein LigD